MGKLTLFSRKNRRSLGPTRSFRLDRNNLSDGLEALEAYIKNRPKDVVECEEGQVIRRIGKAVTQP